MYTYKLNTYLFVYDVYTNVLLILNTYTSWSTYVYNTWYTTFDLQYNMVYDDVYLYTSYKYCLSKTNRIELIVMNVRHVEGLAFFQQYSLR